MASFDSLVRDKIRLFEEVPKRLETAAIKTQAEAWRKIKPLLEDMDVSSNGNIEQTEDNIRRIGLISDELKKVLAS